MGQLLGVLIPIIPSPITIPLQKIKKIDNLYLYIILSLWALTRLMARIYIIYDDNLIKGRGFHGSKNKTCTKTILERFEMG